MSTLNAMIEDNSENHKEYFKEKSSLEKDRWLYKNYFGAEFDHAREADPMAGEKGATHYYETINGEITTFQPNICYSLGNKADEFLNTELDSYTETKKVDEDGKIWYKFSINKSGFASESSWNREGKKKFNYKQGRYNALAEALFLLCTNTDYEPDKHREFNEDLRF